MKPPREQGDRQFNGMDVSIAATAPAYETAVADVGSNHEVLGSWETRRGFTPTQWEGLGLPVNAIACWEAIDHTFRCLISTGQGYYPGVSVPFPAGGYGTGGYGGAVNYGG